MTDQSTPEPSEPPEHVFITVSLPMPALFDPRDYALVVILTNDGKSAMQWHDAAYAAYVLADLARQTEADCQKDPALLARLDQYRAAGSGETTWQGAYRISDETG